MEVVELGIEIGKQFIVVAVAVWILTYVIGLIPVVFKVVPKELLAMIIGLVAITAGYFTGFFEGHWLMVYSMGIIAIFIAQGIYDKIKSVYSQYRENNINQ
jgi:uncharacterized membrane protein